MNRSSLSRAGLARMREVMSGYIERREVPGMVTLIDRRGETHVEVMGHKALGVDDPMRRDTIFRITSMTKPVTAVAAMILVEECRLRLDDPVDRWLPELANRRVLARIDGPLDETVPATRAITLRDLLTFRMGFGMIAGNSLMSSSEYPILKALREQGIPIGPPKPATKHSPDEWMRRLGSMPWMYQPGERWNYNTGSYVLGVLIARASGQSFETFLRQRIFEPLGMKDTGFTVPNAKLGRFATSYMPDSKTGTLVLHDGVQDSQWATPPVFPDGGAGLVSTVDDYLAFGRMLLAKGRHGSERILSRPSVELMTTDQLTPAQKEISGFFPGYWDHRGWGFSVSIVTGRDDLAASPGRYGWDGGYGTTWSNDPAEEMVAIQMTQRGGFPQLSPVYLDFWTSVYASLED